MGTHWLIVQEAKWMAHGGYTRHEAETWMHWINRAEKAGRAEPIPPVTVGGNNWAVECTGKGDAEFTALYLIACCGYVPSMVRVTSRNPTG
jgi:hypothetical protein